MTPKPTEQEPKWQWISKDTASMLMSQEGENRKLKRSVVKEYTRLMNSGMWKLSPHGLVINKSTMRVVDGNHRLNALANSDIDGFWFLVCEWENEAEELRVDRGSGRALVDFIKEYDEWECQCMSSIAQLIGVGAGRRIDPSEMSPICNSFGIHVKDLHDHCRATARGFSAAPVKAVFSYFVASSCEEKRLTIKDQYRSLVLNTNDRMPSIVSLGNALRDGRTNPDEAWARTFIALKNLETTKVIIRDIPGTLMCFRNLVRSYIAKHGQ